MVFVSVSAVRAALVLLQAIVKKPELPFKSDGKVCSLFMLFYDILLGFARLFRKATSAHK
ncbi:hypothetical protein RG47T_2038 [Mucilaginibacter polytrichastri]|uniref:Uncharacterized protein n=1 Tax=Mucilaginibacter polytrichastri TaxID=1302689 RepID=A0A1Q5ZXW9_9SPHI|nr:hypothetical protein RG47T_2038 [Mucilaginibacter polytrichastri]